MEVNAIGTIWNRRISPPNGPAMPSSSRDLDSDLVIEPNELAGVEAPDLKLGPDTLELSGRSMKVDHQPRELGRGEERISDPSDSLIGLALV